MKVQFHPWLRAPTCHFNFPDSLLSNCHSCPQQQYQDQLPLYPEDSLSSPQQYQLYPEDSLPSPQQYQLYPMKSDPVSVPYSAPREYYCNSLSSSYASL